MKTASNSRILRTILLLLVGYFMIGIGVYGCKKEEPVSEDTTPIESKEPVREYAPPIEPIVQEPPKEEILPSTPASLENKLYKQTKIAFVSGRDGNREIYVMNADGSEQKRLTYTNKPARENVGPSWSPDGTKIAFSSDRDRNYEIYVMNADGSGQTRQTNNPAIDVNPSWSPDGKKIAFSSDRDRNYEIFVMDVDGSNQKRLTNNPPNDSNPSWSPDGKKITFTSRRDRNLEIYVMNSDGSNQKRLTDNTNYDHDSDPSWSPDGKKLAFMAVRDENAEIYVMNIDGSEQTNLTNNPAIDANPSWSPDGKKIVFQSYRDGNLEIYVMNADGSEQKRLTDNPAGDANPSWSPYALPTKLIVQEPVREYTPPTEPIVQEPIQEESLPKEPVSLEDKLYKQTKIAFTSRRDGSLEIYVMNIDGSGLKRLTKNSADYANPPWKPPNKSTNANDSNPSWSPDGTKIAFCSIIRGYSDIYVMNIDGSGSKRLTNNPAADVNPSWSPDGTKIAFASERDRNPEIYIMDADGSNQKRLTNNPANDGNLSWSPDGKRIVFQSNRDRNYEIYIMNADGSGQRNLTNNYALDCTPSWSPDGNKIAFSSDIFDRSLGWNICIINADGSGLGRLTNNPANDSYPSWSPDGTKIAFTSERDGNPEIYVMNADGSNQKRLTNNPAWDCYSSWSPYIPPTKPIVQESVREYTPPTEPTVLGDAVARLMDLHSRIESTYTDLQHCHVRMQYHRSDRPGREAWIVLDENGDVAKIRVNVPDVNQTLVWTKEASQTWCLKRNELAIFRDHFQTQKMLFFANRHHPRLVYKHLCELNTEKGIEIRFDDPSDSNDQTVITANYPADTYLIGKPKAPMRDVYYVDSETCCLSKVKIFQFYKGQYIQASTWVYINNVQPLDPNLFDLNHQVPGDVRVTNSLSAEYGLKKGDLSDEQVATDIVEAFLSAWKSQDIQTACKMLGCLFSTDREKIRKQFEKLSLAEIVDVGSPFKKEPYLGLSVLTTIRIEGDQGGKKQMMFMVRPRDGDRWHIASYRFIPVIPPRKTIEQEEVSSPVAINEADRNIKLTWIKCNNSSCKAEYQMSEKDYYKAIQERFDPTARTSPPLTCKKCGKDSVFRAVKCSNPSCGVIFFRDSVPNDFFDRCPECGQSETEEIRKKRMAGR